MLLEARGSIGACGLEGCGFRALGVVGDQSGVRSKKILTNSPQAVTTERWETNYLDETRDRLPRRSTHIRGR